MIRRLGRHTLQASAAPGGIHDIWYPTIIVKSDDAHAVHLLDRAPFNSATMAIRHARTVLSFVRNVRDDGTIAYRLL